MSLPPPPSTESTSQELQHTGTWTFSTPPSWSSPWSPVSSIFFEIYRRSDETRRLPLFFFYLFLGPMHHHQTSSSPSHLPLFTRKKNKNEIKTERETDTEREREREKGDREILRRVFFSGEPRRFVPASPCLRRLHYHLHPFSVNHIWKVRHERVGEISNV